MLLQTEHFFFGITGSFASHSAADPSILLPPSPHLSLCIRETNVHLREKQTDYTNARKAFSEDASILVLMLLSLAHTLHSSLTSAAVGSHAVDSTACADPNRSIWLQEGKRR